MLQVIPKQAISIRPATLADVPFIDALQKANSKMVGWMPQKQLEGKINAGHVIIAESQNDECRMQNEEKASDAVSSFCIQRSDFCIPLGYCIGTDRYFKRDDVGIIYQMNVVPGQRRKLVGATLIKALFDRAAYGCKLYCCWCAQDIEANYFWESLGFIPLAFRSGSAKKARTHIFWQRRIREGDTTTPYWFPSQTNAGALREDRLVLPIPPGTRWSDAKPMVLPREAVKALPEPEARRQRKAPAPKRTLGNPLWFGPAIAEKPKKEKTVRAKVKNNPEHVAAARELRDRYLEHLNGEHLNGEQFNAGTVLPDATGKYDVTRALPDRSERVQAQIAANRERRALPDAA